MRNKSLIVGLLCLFVLMVVFSITTKSQKLEETPLFEPILIGTGGSPHWSPDGTKLAYVYKGALYVTNADGTGERLKVAELPKWTSRFIWADSTEFFFNEFERHRVEGKPGWATTTTIKKLYIDGRIETIVEAHTTGFDVGTGPAVMLNDGTVGYYENLERPTFKIVKPGKLSQDSALKQLKTIPDHQLSYLKRKGQLDSDKGLWVESVDGTIKRQICKEGSHEAYSWPQLSPDGTKILAANALGPDYGLFVLDLNCKILAYLGGGLEDSIELAPGVQGWIGGGGSTARWSPDSKYVIDMASAENEVTVITTDLFLINVDGTGKIRLTNTPDVIEAYPIWSPDGSRIAYVTDITSKIYVMRVK